MKTRPKLFRTIEKEMKQKLKFVKLYIKRQAETEKKEKKKRWIVLLSALRRIRKRNERELNQKEKLS